MNIYCVIGSGISGATIANLLSKKNSQKMEWQTYFFK